ncbi:hypothetical protein [Lacisediminihabitans sp.]|jgi:hypothetical protein|uniref:hypothetical protein n=1 Tax=Lacisediminihabitans sp. TaxID=2787631 RepID=UPI002F945AA6
MPTARLFERMLALCGVSAAALVIVNPGGPAVAMFIVAVWLVLPGWACARPLRVVHPSVRTLIAVLASTAITAMVSLVMVWTRFWYPQAAAVVVLLAASGFMVFAPKMTSTTVAGRSEPPGSARGRRLAGLLSLSVCGIAVILWIVGLKSTNVGAIGTWGLLPAFPLTWYLAVATMLALCLWGLAARRVFPAPSMAGALAVLIAMLYSSANIIEAAPRLPWTYKHIAVTSYIDAFGRVDPSIDLYNRWPGFFSVSAFIGRIANYREPTAYATWAELLFPLIDAALVFGIARAISKNARISWTATLVFSLCNWVNQNYYSPQAFVFTLYLAMCLAVMAVLRGTPMPWVEAIENRIKRPEARDPKHTRTSPAETNAAPAPTGDRWSLTEKGPQRRLRIAAIVAVLILQAIIAASHQLTPYLAVLGLLPLTIVGYVRPRWLGPALLAIAVIYLLPNLGYIQSVYGLFSGFDFFANATYTPPGAAQATDAAQFASRAATILSALTGVLAVAGWLRNLLRGNVGTTIIVGWLAAAPALALLGQTYGGEGRLRVFLFGVPWYAIGVAWLFWSGPVHTRSLILGFSSALTVMAVLFTITYFQPEADHLVSQQDTRASEWLDARVKKDDLAVEAVANFPLFIGSNYRLFDSASRTSSLVTLLKDHSTTVSGASIERYVKSLATAPHSYVIFSDSQTSYASSHRMLNVGVLAAAEQSIRGDSHFRTVYDTAAVRIYELR